MAIPLLPWLGEAHLRETGNLFSADIEEDPWVLYHGTSSLSEPRIDHVGLGGEGHGRFTRSEVAEVCGLFDMLEWAGEDAGGFAVLKPFSLSHDFRDGERKPVFLAEWSHRALLFATTDFAGGETARALRRALRDLDELFSDSEKRTRYLEYRRRRAMSTHGGLLPEDPHSALKWVERVLPTFSELHMRAIRCAADVTHGVVYACRVHRRRLDALELRGTMGVGARHIPASDLIAKVHIPKELSYPPSVRGTPAYRRAAFRGVVAALRTAT